MRLRRVPRPLLALGAVLATAGAFAAAGALTVAQSASAVAAAPPPALIRLVSVTTSAKEIDRPPKGASAGDAVLETSMLYNDVRQFELPKRATVGTDRAVQRLLLKPRRLVVSGVASLPGGTLRFEGAMARNPRGGVVIPVVSGTGRYLGARGSLWILTAGTPKRTLNIYRLTYALFA